MRRADEKERRFQVDVDGAVEGIFIGIHDASARLHRGIIHQAVDPSEVSNGLFNELGGNRGVLEVADHIGCVLS